MRSSLNMYSQLNCGKTVKNKLIVLGDELLLKYCDRFSVFCVLFRY